VTIQSETVEYTQDGNAFEGYLAWNDESATPLPGVLIAHAWGGLGEFERGKARDLAGLGYAGFCLDLFGKGIRGNGPEENAKLIQPFLEDREMLQGRMRMGEKVAGGLEVIDAARLAGIGFCFGGLCVLDLARSGTGLRGVASFHGLFNPPGNTRGKEIDTKILAMHGWDDPMVPPEQVVALAAELTEAGADWQIHGYGHTLHAFTNPAAQNPDMGTQYDEVADRRSWRTLVGFLEELF
jgi:dienelactone hydrolase